MKTTFKTIEDLPLTLQAEHIADILGISRAGAYNLINSESFPTIRIGRRLLVPKEAFINWCQSSIGQHIEV